MLVTCMVSLMHIAAHIEIQLIYDVRYEW